MQIKTPEPPSPAATEAAAATLLLLLLLYTFQVPTRMTLCLLLINEYNQWIQWIQQSMFFFNQSINTTIKRRKDPQQIFHRFQNNTNCTTISRLFSQNTRTRARERERGIYVDAPDTYLPTYLPMCHRYLLTYLYAADSTKFIFIFWGSILWCSQKWRSSMGRFSQKFDGYELNMKVIFFQTSFCIFG